METFLQDLRFALRLLIKRPAFSIIAVATLALGIGANTAIFSVVNGVLLRPLPYPEPQQLVTLQYQQSIPDLDDVKSQSQTFESFGGVVVQALDYTGEAEPLQVQAALVNADLFSALGVNPAVGRTITTDDDRYGAEGVVVLTHAFWVQRFGADPNINGHSIPLSGNQYTVVGVMPADFTMPRETPDLFASLKVVNPVAAKERGVHFLRTYVRLKPGISIEQAQAEMGPIDARLEQQYPEHNRGRQTQLIPLQERIVGNTRPALLILFGAVGLVLLIACANFANLLLAGATSRRQEIVIRQALGARRVRLVRQMLTESVVISIAGGAVGAILATWSVDLLAALKPADLPRLASVRVDGWVLGFTLGISVVTGIVFGLLPSMTASREDVNLALKESGRTVSGSGSMAKLRGVLVVSEIALAVVLLAGAGLLIKGLWKLQSVDPGFNPQNLLTLRIELPESRYREIPKQVQFRKAVLDRLNAEPGIQAAAMISEVPLTTDYLTHNFIIEGRPPIDPGAEPELPVRSVAGDYFGAMGIPLKQGRNFGTEDQLGSPVVGLVNETFVRQYFPGEDPVGKRIAWARGTPREWMTIIGVVGDIKQRRLNVPEEPAFYTSYYQQNQRWKRWMCVVARIEGDMQAVLARVKNQIWAVDGQIPLTRVRSMQEVMAVSIAETRFNTTMMGVFAGVALLLAAVGVYGVISYSVAQRTNEIGIRIALGATTGDVLRAVMGQGLVLTGTGIAAGLISAMALTGLMERLLFGVGARDPLTFAAISVLLALVAMAACFIPARRATRVDPMIALRSE